MTDRPLRERIARAAYNGFHPDGRWDMRPEDEHEDWRRLADTVIAELLGPIPDGTDVSTWTTVRALQLMNEAGQQRAEAESAIARVRALHRDWEADPGHCAHCQDGMGTPLPWPCPTVRALDEPAPGTAATQATDDAVSDVVRKSLASFWTGAPLPREHCGHLSPETALTTPRTECVLRPGHTGSHADDVGCRWWPITEGQP